CTTIKDITASVSSFHNPWKSLAPSQSATQFYQCMAVLPQTPRSGKPFRRAPRKKIMHSHPLQRQKNRETPRGRPLYVQRPPVTPSSNTPAPSACKPHAYPFCPEQMKTILDSID